MIITTPRTQIGYWLDVLLTALGWLFFALVFAAEAVGIMRGEMRGPDVPLLTPKLLSSLDTVLGYLALMAVFTVVLLGWAKYNQYRFRGVDRRRPPTPLTKSQLLASSGMSEFEFEKLRAADMVVIEHDEEGRVVSVNWRNADYGGVPQEGGANMDGQAQAAPTHMAEKTDVLAAARPRKSAERGLHRWGVRRKTALRNSQAQSSQLEGRGSETRQPLASVAGGGGGGGGGDAWSQHWGAGASRNALGDYRLAMVTCRLHPGFSGDQVAITQCLHHA